jgi:hypothetical protein
VARRILRRTDEIAVRLSDMALPELSASEHIVIDGLAVREKGIWRHDGRLTLTNQRVWFLPMKLLYMPRIRRLQWARVECSSHDIVSVRVVGRSIWSNAPWLHGIELTSAKNDVWRFRVWSADKWVAAIQELRESSSSHDV